MRILQVGTGFASMPPRGAYAVERTIHCLSSALVSLGHEVTVLDIEDKKRPPVLYKVVEVPLCWRKDVNLPTHILRGFAFRQSVGQRLRTLLEKEHFDIINFYNQFSASHIPLPQRYNIPAAYSLHNALWYNNHACQSHWQRLKFFQDLRAMRRADTVICQNNTTGSNLAHYFGIPISKIAVIPPGIDESWLAESPASEEIKLKYASKDEPIILNVARIAPYKNQLTLAKAIPLVVQEIPNIRFLFVGPVGDRSYTRKVHQAINEAGASQNAVFLGEIPYADLPQLYSLCRVLAIPSESEGFPLTLLEAMASGKAVVASNFEAFQEMLGERRGITVPTFDYEALANAIVTVLRDDSLRERMGQRAKEHVWLNYRWEDIARRMVGVYVELIAQEGQNRSTAFSQS